MKTLIVLWLYLYVPYMYIAVLRGLKLKPKILRQDIYIFATLYSFEFDKMALHCTYCVWSPGYFCSLLKPVSLFRVELKRDEEWDMGYACPMGPGVHQPLRLATFRVTSSSSLPPQIAPPDICLQAQAPARAQEQSSI